MVSERATMLRLYVHSTLPVLYLFPGSNLGETRWPVCVWSVPTRRELGSYCGTLCWRLVSDIHTRGCFFYFKCSWGSSVNFVTMQWPGWQSNCGLIPRSGDRIFYSTKLPWTVLRPNSPLIQWSRWKAGLLPSCHNNQGMKLTTHLHLAPRLRMSGATSLFPHTLAWHAHGHLYLYLHLWPRLHT